MTTLFPTKDKGATTKLAPMTSVEPELVLTDEDLAAQMPLPGLNAGFLADFMSAALAHERCGTHLYRSVAGRSLNPVLKRKYEEFGEQTLRHVEILEELITTMGGSPMYVSPMARIVEAMDTKLLESTFLAAGSADIMVAEMAMLDAVLLAETIDHGNWQTMAQLAPSLPEGPLADAFNAAVAEVETQEDGHLTWAQEARSRLTMLQAKSDMMTKATAKVEEMTARIASWLA